LADDLERGTLAGHPEDSSTRDPTPNLPEWKERLIRATAVLTLVYTAYYLGWRWTSTLNPDALFFSVALVAAETWGFIGATIMAFTLWRLVRRTPGPPPTDRTVDVFITTYDESVDIVRRTALGALAIRYPHRTWILDDGRREEIRALAEELGAEYLQREGNEHAKAGNLNHALRHTDGEFILQLDADHVPLPHILDRLLGFFDDPRVAFAQSPQDFYNTDSFTHDLDEDSRRMFEEQRIFFTLIQPGKDNWNAAFFCGSCGVIRRAALEEIGGFSTETITEDMETSLLLHARGWKSVYYGESLAYGLAPGSADAFHIQRLRWGQGSMQIWRKFRPLRHPGLSWAQRISYFSSVSTYVDGVQKLVLYLAPIAFFLTATFPIRTEPGAFLIRFVPYLVLSLLMYSLLARGNAYLWQAERYNMAKFFTYILALPAYLSKRPLRFKVTPKGQGAVSFASYAPQLVLLVLSVGSVLWALLASSLGWLTYEVRGWGATAIALNLLWLAWNGVMAAYVIRLCLGMQEQRTDHRFQDSSSVQVHVSEGDTAAATYLAVAENLNPAGLALRSTRALDAGQSVQLTLELATGTFTVRGETLHVQNGGSNGVPTYRHGIVFRGLEPETQDAISLHCVHHATPMWHLQFRPALDLLAWLNGLLTKSRSERRRRTRLPVRVKLAGAGAAGEVTGLIDEWSPSGLRLLLDRPVAPGTSLSFAVPHSTVEGSGSAAFSRALETPAGVRFAVGVTLEADLLRVLPLSTRASRSATQT
jgi:cellulose synthase (UDP-forming)